MILNKKTKFLEGSQAIALTIYNISPEVIAAYPITPQTHIVEDLAKLKAEGKANFEYLNADSELAAASIILGASATGSRVYSATSSQGLILMMEVLYNIAGLRLPVVITIANRAVSAPINIWNDHSDAMAMRDTGWLMLFAENHQEAVDLHVIAYKIAESYNLPVAINVDGFILTHSYENVIIPSKKEIKKYLPNYNPQLGTYLNPKKPITLGGFFTPEYYWLEKQKLDQDLKKVAKNFSHFYFNWKKILPSPINIKPTFDNGLIEYYGPKKPKIILIAMGSIAGTIKEVLKQEKDIGLLKIRVYRPFPQEEIKKIVINCPYLAVLEKANSAGAYGPLYADIMSSIPKYQGIVNNHIVGLGGKDVSADIIKKIIKSTNKFELKFW